MLESSPSIRPMTVAKATTVEEWELGIPPEANMISNSKSRVLMSSVTSLTACAMNQASKAASKGSLKSNRFTSCLTMVSTLYPILSSARRKVSVKKAPRA